MRVVMAHELGHAILHMKEDCCFIKNHTLFLASRLEIQANLFTAELILPDGSLQEYAQLSVYDAANILGLNSDLVRYRLGGIQVQL